MKKRIIVPTVLAGILGGFVLTQTQLFSSAEQAELLTATEAKELALKEFSGDIVEFDFDRDKAPHYEFEIINGTEKVELVVDAQSGAVLITEREAIKKSGSTEAPAVTNSSGTVENKLEAVEQKVENAVENVENKVDSAVANVQIKADGAAQKVVSTPASKDEVVPVPAPEKSSIITRAQAIAIAQAKASGTVVDVDFDDDDFEYEIEIKNGNTEYEFEINAKTGAITKFEKDVDDDQDDD